MTSGPVTANQSLTANFTLFEATPGMRLIFLPDAPRFTIAAATQDVCVHLGMARSELVGQSVFEAFPPNPSDPADTGQKELRASLEQVLQSRVPHHLPTQRYDVQQPDGSFKKHYWKVGNYPVIEGGRVSYIIHITQDITDEIETGEIRKQFKSMEQVNALLEQAPVAMCIFRGPEYIIELANEQMYQLWGRSKAEVLGKPVFEAMPEVKHQGYEELLHNVFTTGERFKANGIPVTLPRNGGVERVYINLLYEPYREADGLISGVIAVAIDVTEQVLARMKVEASNRELQFVMDVMPQMVWHTSPEGTADFFNKVYQDYTGLTQEQLVAQQWIGLVHPNDVSVTTQAFGQALSGATDRYAIEHRLRGKDGHYNWFLTRGVPLKNEAGAVLKWYGTSTNIQEQKTAAEILRTVTANTTLALFMLDKDRNCIYMNEAAEQMTGFSFGEIKGKNLHYQIHHSHPDGSPYPLEACPLVCYLPSGALQQGEEVFIHKEGRFYPVAFTASPIILNDTTLGTVLEVRDITAEKKQELEQKESEARFRLIANSLPVVSWTASPDGNLTFISNQWEEDFGNPISESLGTGWASFVHPDDIGDAAKTWAHSLQTGQDYETEFRVKHKSGEYRWQLVRAIPIRSRDGNIIQWYGSNTEIQDKKLFEEQLERRVKERTQELEQFTYVSHHDLQEPLRKIVMFTDLVQKEANEKLSENALKRLQRVSDAAQRMSHALRDVLNFASLSKEEQFCRVNLGEVLAAVRNDLELAILEKRATLHQDALPTIKGDPAQMHQLFYNLVNNALKFSKEGTFPVIHIRCTLPGNEELSQYTVPDPQQRYYFISVADNGIGFDQHAANKIFVMFQRLHSKSDYAGTGIGLALCKKVVLNHGGKIWAEGHPGEGATFRLLLPAD